jgi:hypothetical protein
LYPDAARETWLQVVPICGTVFQHLVESVLGFSFGSYAEFPERYLQNASVASRPLSPLHFVTIKSLDAYKYLRRRHLPRGPLLPYRVSRVVYAVVPLVFIGWASSKETLPTLLCEARRWLGMICPLESPQTDPRHEWDALRQSVLWAWKNFCY